VSLYIQVNLACFMQNVMCMVSTFLWLFPSYWEICAGFVWSPHHCLYTWQSKLSPYSCNISGHFIKRGYFYFHLRSSLPPCWYYWCEKNKVSWCGGVELPYTHTHTRTHTRACMHARYTYKIRSICFLYSYVVRKVCISSSFRWNSCMLVVFFFFATDASFRESSVLV
jgi:hypothetical protein